MNIKKELLAMQDKEYKLFQEKLMPTVEKDRVIGVRTPVLRRYATELAKKETAAVFMAALPHFYYEENNLHAFLIEKIGDFEKTVDALEKFLPYVDNWATCDAMNPKIFAKNKEKLLPYIEKWLASPHIYEVRFAIVMLMKYFLDDDFKPEYLEMVAALRSDTYYIEMAIAWFFAEALIQKYDDAVPYLEKKLLAPWVHNKTISKYAESLRANPMRKAHLKALRI